MNGKSSATHLATGTGDKGMGDKGDFIAGVFLPATREKLSIQQAMTRGLLSPGTALVLLEVQAASGLLTEPARNRRLWVRDALAQGLIGHRFVEQLLSAEGAVRGYPDPHTGHRMSLCQAMRRGLILRDHGLRLLQAQLATGGIIDPHGQRVPVEVACERGYLDQEMSQLLSDPKSRSRSCFDPNTQENLTYLQLLHRCVPDPDTGLLMLQLMDKGSALSQLSQDARTALQAARTTLALGLFQGQSVSAWELLLSRYVREDQRQELLRKLSLGSVTIAQMVELLTAMVTAAERDSGAQGSAEPCDEVAVSPPAWLRQSLKYARVRVTAGALRGRSVSVLDLLFSGHVPQGTRQQLLELHRAGALSTQQVASVVATMVNGAQATLGARSPHGAGEDEEGGTAHLDEALKATSVEVAAGEAQGRRVTLWELLHSQHIPEEKRLELLGLYRDGVLNLELMSAVVTILVSKKGSTGRKFQITVKGPSQDPVAAAGQEGDNPTLKTTRVGVEAAEFWGHAATGSDPGIEPGGHRSDPRTEPGGVGSDPGTEAVATEAEAVATETEPVATEAEAVATEAEPSPLHGDGAWKGTLKATRAEVPVAQGSLWELLHSRHIPEEKRQELLELFWEGTLPLEQLELVVTALIKNKECTGRKFRITVKGPSQDPVTAAEEGDNSPWEMTLKTTRVRVEAAEFRGREVSLWELLHSQYIPEESREELLGLFRNRELSLEQLRDAVSTVVSRAATGEGTGRGGHESDPGTEPGGHGSDPSDPGTEPGGHGSDPGTEPGGHGSDPRADPVALGRGPRAEPMATEAGPVATEAEPVATEAEPVATEAKPVATEAEPGPLLTVDLLRSEGSHITLGPCQARCQDPCRDPCQVSVWQLLHSRRVSEYHREARLETFPRAGLRVNRITITTTVRTGPGTGTGTTNTAWYQ